MSNGIFAIGIAQTMKFLTNCKVKKFPAFEILKRFLHELADAFFGFLLLISKLLSECYEMYFILAY